MPGLDGLEVIRALRRESPNVSVIAMSGGAFGGAMDLLSVARRLGAMEILRKPFTRRELLDAVGPLLQTSPSNR
jgi:DNA-binding response OmpR family regulator